MKNPATVIVAICLLTAFPKGAVAQDADPMAGFPLGQREGCDPSGAGS